MDDDLYRRDNRGFKRGRSIIRRCQLECTEHNCQLGINGRGYNVKLYAAFSHRGHECTEYTYSHGWRHGNCRKLIRCKRSIGRNRYVRCDNFTFRADDVSVYDSHALFPTVLFSFDESVFIWRCSLSTGRFIIHFTKKD